MSGGKRKATDDLQPKLSPKKSRSSGPKAAFRDDLFDATEIQTSKTSYSTSTPYPYAVVKNLIQPDLLRRVRREVSQIQFKLKETDIYRIEQCGDLANLDGLPDEELKKLPGVRELRDALYSSAFREWVSEVTGAGKLSGKKTDMAVNIYKPGCYLLCHDDVIGSRKVSYILYLTDPDDEWKPEWGGALRLYPTKAMRNKDGDEVKVPQPDHCESIPPSFSQLSFFAVRPGESYHDVEEVYFGKDSDDYKRRTRIAVSGWFHLPQEGEDGYEQGAEETQKKESSLAQLQSTADEFDQPQTKFRHFDESREVANAQGDDTETDAGDEDDRNDKILTDKDLTFLIKYISPGFLIPDKLDELSNAFTRTSSFELQKFLSPKFAEKLEEQLKEAEKPTARSASATDTNSKHSLPWKVAGPPNKQRFMYLQEDTSSTSDDETTPISNLLNDLIHSHAFKKWIALATALKPAALVKQHALARRFRAGSDYALGSKYTRETPQLEFTISITPKSIFKTETTIPLPDGKSKKPASNKSSKDKSTKPSRKTSDAKGKISNGGEEVYIADESAEELVFDPAVFQAMEDDTDVLLQIPPAWNTFNAVLRDANTLRCVNYVSKAAKGSRWDIKGEIELSEDAFEDDGVDDMDLSGMYDDDEEEEEDENEDDKEEGDGQDEDDEEED